MNLQATYQENIFSSVEEMIFHTNNRSLTTEEVFALNLKKGDKVKFSHTRYGRVLEGKLISLKKRRFKTGKTFNGRYWQDGEWKTGYEVVIHVDRYDRKIVYELLTLLEKIENVTDYNKNILELISGQTAEELLFCWKLSDLKEFASALKIKNRSKMTKAQLAMAIEDVVNI